MSRVDGIVKILIDEGYSPSQLFENFDEVLAKHEKITYKSGTKSHEFRYIHSGYYNNVIVIDGKYKDMVLDDYQMLVQAMYLTKFIAESKSKDLSKVEYNPLCKTLYKCRFNN